MEMLEALRATLQELFIPELRKIQSDLREIKAILLQHVQRLGNLEHRMTQQGLRLDGLIDELSRRTEQLRAEWSEPMRDGRSRW